MKIRNTAALLAAVMMLVGSGCAEKKPASSESESKSSSEGSKVSPGKVELKTYEFPSFLEGIKLPDMLGKEVMTSFDPETHVSIPESQPFSDYNCIECIDGILFVFQKDKYKGLLNSRGYVVLEPDTYTEIKCCAPGMLVMSRDKELASPDDHAYYDNMGNISVTETYTFDSTKISLEPVVRKNGESSGDDPLICYDLRVNEQSISELSGLGDFINIESVAMADVDTTKVYNAYYRLFTDQGYYFLCVDRYYNFTVFSGAYAYVRIRVGDSYGECYILDGEDYGELLRMIDSFGVSSTAKIPSKDEGLDYIQIETGIGSSDRVVYTISADGFCLTDERGEGKNGMDKYFTNFDKESFVSLVQWVDQVLSREYQ